MCYILRMLGSFVLSAFSARTHACGQWLRPKNFLCRHNQGLLSMAIKHNPGLPEGHLARTHTIMLGAQAHTLLAASLALRLKIFLLS